MVFAKMHKNTCTTYGHSKGFHYMPTLAGQLKCQFLENELEMKDLHSMAFKFRVGSPFEWTYSRYIWQ